MNPNMNSVTNKESKWQLSSEKNTSVKILDSEMVGVQEFKSHD